MQDLNCKKFTGKEKTKKFYMKTKIMLEAKIEKGKKGCIRR